MLDHSLGIQALKDGDRAKEELQEVLEVQRGVAYEMIDKEIKPFTPAFLEFDEMRPDGTKGVLGEMPSYPKISWSPGSPSLMVQLTDERSLVETGEDKYELKRPDTLPKTEMTQGDELHFEEEIAVLQDKYDVKLPEGYALKV